ncbi:hypothetical protein [Bradyrhizobium sp. 162]|uniref:hypothetical protein n=1 Tax=Bradyrhizobium sp. 162 TaxID=2782635 RepID=UPI001FF8A79E|nr:hypothetical protein [Bradyrhizobium sp. 162]MCK1629927.1 hypothetical protein [Bradyrhizobium sp. 162]
MRKLIPFFVLVMLFLVGLVGVFLYAYLADRYCQFEGGETHASHVSIYPNHGERQVGGSTRYGESQQSEAEATLLYLVANEPEHLGGAPQAESKKTPRWIVKFFCEAKAADAALVFFTYGLMIVTGWLAWATLKLWQSAESTADAQEKNTRILQRAYLGVEPLGIDPRHERWRALLHGEKGPLQSVAQVIIKNSGNLPARNIEWTIEHKFCRERYLNDFPFDILIAEGEGTLPPRGAMIHGGKTINAGSDDGCLRLEAERFLYVWGLVRYEDGFGTTRTTKFCHRYNCANVENIHGEKEADAGGKGPVIGLKIRSEFARVHRYGNDAD